MKIISNCLSYLTFFRTRQKQSSLRSATKYQEKRCFFWLHCLCYHSFRAINPKDEMCQKQCFTVEMAKTNNEQMQHPPVISYLRRQICFELQFNFTFRNLNNAIPFIPYTIMHIIFKQNFNSIQQGTSLCTLFVGPTILQRPSLYFQFKQHS